MGLFSNLSQAGGGGGAEGVTAVSLVLKRKQTNGRKLVSVCMFVPVGS